MWFERAKSCASAIDSFRRFHFRRWRGADVDELFKMSRKKDKFSLCPFFWSAMHVFWVAICGYPRATMNRNNGPSESFLLIFVLPEIERSFFAQVEFEQRRKRWRFSGKTYNNYTSSVGWINSSKCYNRKDTKKRSICNISSRCRPNSGPFLHKQSFWTIPKKDCNFQGKLQYVIIHQALAFSWRI